MIINMAVRFARGAVRFARGAVRFARGAVRFARGAAWFGRGAAWLARHSAVALLTLTASGLAAGLLLWLAGATGARDAVWAAVGICGAGYALWAMADALR